MHVKYGDVTSGQLLLDSDFPTRMTMHFEEPAGDLQKETCLHFEKSGVDWVQTCNGRSVMAHLSQGPSGLTVDYVNAHTLDNESNPIEYVATYKDYAEFQTQQPVIAHDLERAADAFIALENKAPLSFAQEKMLEQWQGWMRPKTAVLNP